MRPRTISALARATIALTLLVPTAVFASGGCTVGALDTVAGLGTQVTLSACESAKQLTITVTGPAGGIYTQAIVTDAKGHATTLIPSKATTVAGLYRIAVGGSVGSFSVIPDRADALRSILAASPTSIVPGGARTVTVTAVLKDRYDNPIAGRALALISNRATDDVSPQMDRTDDDGRFVWTVRPTENGTMSLLPYDIILGKQLSLRADVAVGTATPSSWLSGALTGTERGGESIDIAAAASPTTENTTVERFDLSLPDGSTQVKANELFSLVVKAMRGNDVVRSYIGSLEVSSTDPGSQLPKKNEDPKAPDNGRIDMTNVYQGVKNVPLSFLFQASGRQTITVRDKLDPTIMGSITLTVVRGNSTGQKIDILIPKDGTSIKGGDTIEVQGRAPSLINLTIKGNIAEPVATESDGEGVFRAKVRLNPGDKEVTLIAESENKTFESDPVHFSIDNDAPVIDGTTVSPQDIGAGEPGTITVRSEAGLLSVVATLDGKDLTLAPAADNPKQYAASVNVPTKEGAYNVRITATDSVGNASTSFVTWTVKTKTVPVVTGVSAEAQGGQILLKWQAITSMPIAQYKIYIATQTDPQNILWSIGTQRPVTSASIRDLPLGKTYVFTLTAINTDGVESQEKSSAVAAAPLGLTLKTKPGSDNVLLSWEAMQNLPLANYTLEYGTDQLTEKRTVNGQATSVMVRDLLPGVTYQFKLTPTAITGTVLAPLSATTRVTLAKGGFSLTSADPVPTNAFPPLHSGADQNPPYIEDIPMTTTSGVSTMVMGLLLVASVIIGMSVLRLRREHRTVQAFLRSLNAGPDS